MRGQIHRGHLPDVRLKDRWPVGFALDFAAWIVFPRLSGLKGLGGVSRWEEASGPVTRTMTRTDSPTGKASVWVAGIINFPPGPIFVENSYACIFLLCSFQFGGYCNTDGG